MKRSEQIWWVALTVLSLAAFSFFAGYGLRGLYSSLARGTHGLEAAFPGYPRIASAAPRVPDPDLRPATLFTEVLRKLQLYYVDELPPPSQLAYGTAEGILNELKDPNTRMLGRAEMNAIREISAGNYPGLGAVLTIRRHSEPRTGQPPAATEAPRSEPSGVRTLTVVAVAPGGPAEKAGLQPGDRITEIDGRWIAPVHVSYRVMTQITDPIGPQDGPPPNPDEELTPPEDRDRNKKELEATRRRWQNAIDLPAALQILLGEKGERELTVERGSPSRTLKVKVTLGETKAPLVTARTLDPTTGYLRLLALNAATVEQATAALHEFQKGGIKNLVIDLRQSPGGSIDSAREIAGLLLGDARFAVLKVRNAERKLVDQVLTTRPGTFQFRPAALAVLVDGGTAGSSELLAAALRENAGAKLVGDPTFGDGTEQEVVRLDDGTGFSITRAKMLTSKGVDYDGKGLSVDLRPDGDPLAAALRVVSRLAPTRTAGNRHPVRVP